MNLVDGAVIDAKQADQVLDTLSQRILSTLAGPPLDPAMVLGACDHVLRHLDREKYLDILSSIGIERQAALHYIEMAQTLFSAPYLRARMERELGSSHLEEQRYTPPFSGGEVRERVQPLGVLLHIAAGNVDGLPAFSVLEGLLTGNINILKLPEVDGGISILLLQELVQVEPSLAGYVYVFDYSSKDTSSISKLVDAADGVVVWGGDGAVGALRTLIPPETKLIEWGHKVSFAYVTKQLANPEALSGLAAHICETNQLFCSSCQGIYLDTDSQDDIHDFCRIFLPVLEQAASAAATRFGIATQAQITLQLHTQQLLSADRKTTLYRGKGCSLIASRESLLEPSMQFRNCWVKPLPREKLLSVLRPHKNHLQTAALLCGNSEREELENILMRTGIVRITSGQAMSSSYCGGAHDGEYSLRRYTKIVSFE